MKIRNDTRAGLMALSLSLLLLPLVSLISEPARADEFMKWERIPLQIPLQVGLERVVFVDKNVRVGFPPALNGKLRVQSTGGAVYLKADSAFPQTRVQLQDVESGEVILLDVTAGEKGPSEPVRLVYSGEVNTVSSTVDTRRQAENSSGSVQPGSDDGTQAKRKKVQYSAPIPVLLTRYAAQSLYAPLRTVEAVPGIRPVNPHLPKRLTTLYPSEAITSTPLKRVGRGKSRRRGSPSAKHRQSQDCTGSPGPSGAVCGGDVPAPLAGAGGHAGRYHHSLYRDGHAAGERFHR